MQVYRFDTGSLKSPIKTDDGFLKVKVGLTITDDDAIEDMKNGKAQLSCGYVCDLENTSGEFNGERYDAIQKNIRYNHLAIVNEGRAGPEARVRLDSNQAIQIFSKGHSREDGNPKPLPPLDPRLRGDDDSSSSRSRNGPYGPPPPQIRTSATNASGSCLR